MTKMQHTEFHLTLRKEIEDVEFRLARQREVLAAFLHKTTQGLEQLRSSRTPIQI